MDEITATDCQKEAILLSEITGYYIMPHLKGATLGTLLQTMFDEYKHKQTIFNYPATKIFRGFDGYDLSVKLYGHEAYTPLGPAAGPHTQLAQNILLSFLGGSRIIELKTIQILDDLTIPRPCIDMRNIGFNVEWSQELRLAESLREYVKAWLLLHILRESELLGIDKDDPFYNTIFDVSVGYDLQGISSEPVSRWIDSIKYATPVIEEVLDTLPKEFGHFKKIKIDPQISQSITLSTFHGCPPDEIESIVRHLIAQHGMHVVVKMNPTLLGYNFVHDLLIDTLGYRHLQLDEEAFANDMTLDDALAMMRRLDTFACENDKTVGVKFTNTLVVKNNETIFREPVRYLSGPPLYVLAMHTMHTFREKLDVPLTMSYSGGINKNNFSEALSCNLTPVTTCTDLLKKGGYSKLYTYLTNLKKDMDRLSVRSVEEFILSKAENKFSHVQEAGRYNSSQVLRQITSQSPYSYGANTALPKKIGSQLHLFDCLSCDICLPVCPNAANFHYKVRTAPPKPVLFRWNNGRWEALSGKEFSLDKEWQIGNIAEFCNDCGNCDTFCPEDGGPYLRKPRFFLYRSSFDDWKHLDGFYFVSPRELLARFSGRVYRLTKATKDSRWAWKTPDFELIFDSDCHPLPPEEHGIDLPEKIDVSKFFIMKQMFSIIDESVHAYPHALLVSV